MLSTSTGTSIPSRFRQTMQSLPLPAKLALAVVSGCTYWMLGFLSERSDAIDAALSCANSGWHSIAVVFGVLVMAPYAASARFTLLRALALCAASAAIYYDAVRFVIDGPLGYDTVAPFAIAGGLAALLVGIAVALMTARPLRPELMVWMLVAGTAGGAAFDLDFGLSSDLNLTLAHIAWQSLVCLALHVGLRAPPARSG